MKFAMESKSMRGNIRGYTGFAISKSVDAGNKPQPGKLLGESTAEEEASHSSAEPDVAVELKEKN
jgi:hypothetical protein